MTRPIYEPSLQRTDARLGYGNAQLFRRPAPRGCPCPLDTAIAYDSVTGSGTANVADNTTTDIIFDQMSLATGTQAFAEDQGAGTARPFKALLDGWYIGYINFEWDAAPYTDVRTYALYSNVLPDNCGSQNVVESESSPFINSAFNGTFGPLYIRATNGVAYFKTIVHQQTGGSKGVTGVLMTVMYLGPDLDQDRWPPF